MEQGTPHKAKSSWIKTTILVVGAILAFLFAKGIGTIVGRSAADQFSAGYNASAADSIVTKGIQQSVERIRPQLPLHIDDITTTRDALAAGKEIIYIMELNADIAPADIDAVQQKLSAQNTKNVCANDNVKTLIKMGGKMTWQYTVKSGDQFRVSVTKCD
jgi:hypothetical protein